MSNDAAGAAGTPAPASSWPTGRRITIRDLAEAKHRQERWPMLTAYDQYAAEIFDEAGIPVLLVGDSAADNVLGHENTVPVTTDELLPFVRAVVRASKRSLVVADLPFGSYEAGPEQAFATAVRFMKEAGAHAVKFEGGARVIPQVELLTRSGIPVMGHLGLTPQSVHAFGGYRVQGRGEAGEQLLADAKSLEQAGAFAVVLEVVPAELAARVTASLSIPTIGIGAGAACDAQVLVWQDLAGLRRNPAKFVKQYADVRGALTHAAQEFAADVARGTYPDESHTYH
jgi:3-methyl-2-oxobutanoate hydroxymethyltransferase